jgi:ATP-dependent Lon protease
MFAVGHLQAGETVDPSDSVDPVGTLGLVRASQEQEDGTSQLLLHGVLRVRFVDWPGGRVYPFAEIEPIASEPMPTDQAAAAICRLRALAGEMLMNIPDEVSTTVMSLLNQVDDPALMGDLVAQQFVQDPEVRQSLLADSCVGTRIKRLCKELRRLIDGLVDGDEA